MKIIKAAKGKIMGRKQTIAKQQQQEEASEISHYAVSVSKAVCPFWESLQDGKGKGKSKEKSKDNDNDFCVVNDCEDAVLHRSMFHFGTTDDCLSLELCAVADFGKDYPDSFHKGFPLSEYYWRLRGLLLNFGNGSYFKHVGHLSDSDAGNPGTGAGMFCRCDAGDGGGDNSSWRGQVISGANGIEAIKSNLIQSRLMFLSPAKNIEPMELRCWTDKGNVIACCRHNERGRRHGEDLRVDYCHEGAVRQIAPLIKEAYNRYPVFEPYVINLCVYQGMLKIVDLESFSTARFLEAESFLEVVRYTKDNLI